MLEIQNQPCLKIADLIEENFNETLKSDRNGKFERINNIFYEKMAKNEVRFLNPPKVEAKKKKYCRFKKLGIKYIDYKDPDFLLKFVNEQGKLLPRRLTGTSLKFQRKVSQAVKRARHIAIMPYLADCLK